MLLRRVVRDYGTLGDTKAGTAGIGDQKNCGTQRGPSLAMVDDLTTRQVLQTINDSSGTNQQHVYPLSAYCVPKINMRFKTSLKNIKTFTSMSTLPLIQQYQPCAYHMTRIRGVFGIPWKGCLGAT
jgi:hypothetical protein